MLRLTKWRNPTTLDVRVYVNGHDLRGKVWLEKASDGRCLITTDDKARLDLYKDIVNEAFADLDLSPNAMFTDVLKEASW